MSLKSISLHKFGIFFLFLIFLLFLIILFFFLIKKEMFNSNYFAVYLKTGDIYFGRISHFPSFTLSNVWYLKREPNGEISLQRFQESAWGPEDKLKINKDQIVWIARISPSSQLLSIINGTPISSLPVNDSVNFIDSNSSSSLPFSDKNISGSDDSFSNSR